MDFGPIRLSLSSAVVVGAGDIEGGVADADLREDAGGAGLTGQARAALRLEGADALAGARERRVDGQSDGHAAAGQRVGAGRDVDAEDELVRPLRLDRRGTLCAQGDQGPRVFPRV